jgi:hypothetical protein
LTCFAARARLRVELRRRLTVSVLAASDRVLLGLVLVCTGALKLTTPTRELREVALADLVGRFVTRTLGRGLKRNSKALRALFAAIGTVEIALGGWLISGYDRTAAATTVATLFVAGLAYMIWAHKHAPTKSCGCAGTREPVGLREILRTATFLGAAALTATGAVAPLAVGLALIVVGTMGLLDDWWTTTAVPRLWRALFGRRTLRRLYESQEWQAMLTAVPGVADWRIRDDWQMGRTLIVSRSSSKTESTPSSKPSTNRDTQSVVASVLLQRCASPPIRIVQVEEKAGRGEVRTIWATANSSQLLANRPPRSLSVRTPRWLSNAADSARRQ